jgi:hypothetical protein
VGRTVLIRKKYRFTYRLIDSTELSAGYQIFSGFPRCASYNLVFATSFCSKFTDYSALQETLVSRWQKDSNLPRRPSKYKRLDIET